jgi:starch phosphorylase
LDTRGLSESLLALAHNHRWTWSPHVRSIFEALPGFSPEQHPVQLVAALGDDQLASLLTDVELMGRINHELAELSGLTRQEQEAPEIAYFSPEFGISDLVPQYSGGLGVLAGDHLKAASDLGMSLCGVGLFYRGGFFHQGLAGGRQVERYETYEPEDLGCVDTGIEVSIPLIDHDVVARVWRLEVGRISLILLDTDVEPNSAADRLIADRLYSGDRRHRLEQELVLGVGGSRALAALGWAPPVRHLNEGHAGFLILDLLDRQIESGLSLRDALAAIKPGLIFTTHTPVPAGIDRFEVRLATEYLAPWAERWDVPVTDLLALGADPGDEPAAFNMAAFCLKAAGRANGVSQLHGLVSRELFAGVPGGDAISSVTNGVHARTWVMPRLQSTFDTVLGPGWADGDSEAWQRVDDISDEEIRSLRRAGSAELSRVVSHRAGTAIDPDSLIIGFARRFATYKRATLLLQHPEELAAILGADERPVYFVFAGKAHPADDEGKALLADIVSYGNSAQARGRFILLPDYDMAVAAAMYAGCDVWLNNPVRPHEASGTSGEKSALNGGLNCSISDGWWDEMADGQNGWTIAASDATVASERDLAESAAALRLLSERVIPEYFAEHRPWSATWIERIRCSWRSLGPQITAGRMVAEYGTRLYQPALDEVCRQ